MANTRFAPSPTGYLHIGGVRTALYAYALAKSTGGKFILRIEDTDQSRKVEGSVKVIEDSLKAYGLEWDEKYVQSERLAIYQEYAEKLIEAGAAYYCFATEAEIEEAKQLAEKNNQRFIFTSPYRDLNIEQAKTRVAAGEEYVVRLKVPRNQKIKFKDGLQGTMEFDTSDVNDGVLLKSDGFPTYHLAMVVDDHLMDVTHVFRGIEWIPSTPKHILMFEALGWEMPEIYHLPVILDPAGGKLSKRKGAVSAEEFLNKGYLAEAVNNFLMLLGWSAPLAREHGQKEREFFSLKDFVELFKLEDLNKSSAVFDRVKLEWFNQQYIMQQSGDQLLNKFTNWFNQHASDEELKQLIADKGPDYLQDALLLVQNRAKTLADIPEAITSLYREGELVDIKEIKQLKKLDQPTFKQILEKFLERLSQVESIKKWGHDNWEKSIRDLADELDVKHGMAFMSLRVATTDSTASPPLFESMEILGKETVMHRINRYT